MATPQTATNQASESHASTSSRLIKRLALRANRKVLALLLLSFVACFDFVTAVGLGLRSVGASQRNVIDLCNAMFGALVNANALIHGTCDTARSLSHRAIALGSVPVLDPIQGGPTERR